MRINFIIPHKRLSGGNRVIYIYANYLTSMGHDVCCYLPAISYPAIGVNLFLRTKASIGNLINTEHWFDCNFPVKVVPKINDCFVRDADVVIATAVQTAFDVDRLSSKKGKKNYFVQDYEVFSEDENMVIESYKLGMPIITITKELGSIIDKYNTNVKVVHNGLFPEEFIKEGKQKNDILHVMTMYHSSPRKRTKDALEVFSNAASSGLEIVPVIFGRKIDRVFPHYYIVRENPKREELIEMYQKSDAYLFTSEIDAWGLPIVEAMANKCAVIGRNIGALKELHTKNNSVIINSSTDYLKVLKLLNNNRNMLYSIQNKGYETVQDLRWEKSASLFEKLLLRE